MAIKRLLKKINPDIVLIQETKRHNFDRAFIKSIWSSKDVGWAYTEANGWSGGLLTMWDEGKLLEILVIKAEFSLSVKCSIICKKVCWITNVYGPTNYRERNILRAELSSLAEVCVEPWSLGGDFNSIRQRQERFPMGRATRDMRKFNRFIEETNLIEIPLSDGRFTWSREGETSARSLIDKFLVSNNWEKSL